MTALRIGLGLLLCTGCRDRPGATVALPDEVPSSAARDQPPLPLNAEPPVEYPAALADQRIGGRAVLRLFLDSTGRVVPESTSVQESSGYPALDSAALAATPRLRYAPALRDGAPVAVPFLQPFNFRPPSGGATTP